jgi:hypothetical protein
MGAAHGIYPWDITLVRRSLNGETFLGRLWMVFLGGVGEGKRTHEGKYCRVVFVGDTRVQTTPFLGPLDDLFHTQKTVKGLLHLVPSRTSRISGYGVLCTCVGIGVMKD